MNDVKAKKCKELMLPTRNYGPICMKILKEFIAHHHLPEDLPLPSPGIKSDQMLARIFDVMLHTLGKEKRDAFLKDAEDYYYSLPPSVR